jgi:hypothetical protein
MQRDGVLGYLKLLPWNFYGKTEEKHLKFTIFGVPDEIIKEHFSKASQLLPPGAKYSVLEKLCASNRSAIFVSCITALSRADVYDRRKRLLNLLQ